MGSCFSSGGGEEAAAGHGVEKQRKVYPSDEDGRWPYIGERDVDNKAAVFIAKFHRHLSGAFDRDDPKAEGDGGHHLTPGPGHDVRRHG